MAPMSEVAILSALSLFSSALALVSYFNTRHWGGLLFLSASVLSVFFFWLSMIWSESDTFSKMTQSVGKSFKYGFCLFILSEIMVFFGVFWCFFSSSLSPSIEIFSWPPLGVRVFNPLGVPLLNTVVLLSSGASVTWSHHSLVGGTIKNASLGLLFSVFLGLLFSALQALEYKMSFFDITDSVFGTVFFVTTGLHGVHVLVGTLGLCSSWVQMESGGVDGVSHTGVELAIWYWHFVDVVWLVVFIWLYIWPASF